MSLSILTFNLLILQDVLKDSLSALLLPQYTL